MYAKDPNNADRLLALNPDGSATGKYLAVDAAGHLCAVELASKLKDGWRLATPADCAAAIKAEEARTKPAPKPVAKPTV